MVRLLAVIGIGALHGWLALRFWGVYVVDNPVNSWLIDTFATNGHEVAYFVSMYLHDLIVNTLLAIPAAILITILQPRNIVISVVLALCAALVVSFWGSNVPGLLSLLNVWSFWAGQAVFAAALPLAAIALTKIGRQRIAT